MPVQSSRGRIAVLNKVIYRPLLPLNCYRIYIEDGEYEIAQTTVNFDETTINILLAPMPVDNASLVAEDKEFDRTVQLLKEEGWHE